MRRLPMWSAALAAALSATPALAGPLSFGIVGDNLSEPYANYATGTNPATGGPYWGTAGDRNWVELLQGQRGNQLSALYNFSKAGATSSDLLDNGAANLLAGTVQFGLTKNAVVLFGNNDLLNYLTGPPGTDPAPVIAGLAANVAQVVGMLKTAGAEKVVVGTLPDPSVTPAVQAMLGGTPGALEGVAALVQAANQAISGAAAESGASVVDVYGLSRRAAEPLTVGETTFDPGELFTPDGYYPGTVLQGLLANAVLDTLGGPFAGLKLTDTEILAANEDRGGGLAETPEPATLTLLGLAAAGGLAFRRRRWAVAA
jgi:hypothetical protein